MLAYADGCWHMHMLTYADSMDFYVQRHDGEAVTCDDFRSALADANNADLAQV